MGSKTTNAQIVSSYSKGCTLKEIAGEAELRIPQVRAILVDSGVSIRKRGFASMTPEQRSRISVMGGASVASGSRAYSRSPALAKKAGARGGMAKHHGTPSDGHGLSPTSPYRRWRGMLSRCTNPADPGYARYGGRGIAICQRWLTFENFLADTGEAPPGMSLDRIDNDGPYSPENCRWATFAQQMDNRSCTRFVTARGQTLPATRWAAVTGVPRGTILARIRKGWTHDDAVSTPLRRRAGGGAR